MSRRRARARRAAALAVFPDTVELVIIAIRAGLAPSGAIEVVAEHGDPAIAAIFGEVVRRMHRGQRLADALAALPEMIGDAARPFADALSSAERYGQPLEPVLERLTLDAHTDRRHQAERFARTLPVKLSFPLVVCTLPSFVFLAIVPALMGAISTLRATAP